MWALGTLGGGDRPSEHKWPWEASRGQERPDHRSLGHIQGWVGVVGRGRGGAQAGTLVYQFLMHPKGNSNLTA